MESPTCYRIQGILLPNSQSSLGHNVASAAAAAYDMNARDASSLSVSSPTVCGVHTVAVCASWAPVLILAGVTAVLKLKHSWPFPDYLKR